MLNATDNMSGVLKSAGGSVKGLESTMVGAGHALAKFATVAAVGGIAAVGAGVVTATKQFASFESEMNILQATSKASDQQMAELGKQAKALGSDLNLPSTSSAQAAKAMGELARAGLSVNDVMLASRGVLQLAAAAGIDEAQAATLTAGALNAFGLSGDNATRVANELAYAANASSLSAADLGQSVAQAGFIFKATGRPMEELLSSMIVLGNAGLSGSDGATALKNAVQRMVAPTDEAKKVMKQYGIEVNDASGTMKSVPDIIDNLNSSLGGLTDEQRNAALATIGQSDGMKALIPLMAAGGDVLRKYEADLRTSNAAQEQADARAKGLAGAWAGAKSQLETLATTLGEKFAPAIEGGLRSMGDFIGKAATFAEGLDFSGIGTAIQTVMSGISTIIAGAIGEGSPAREAWNTFIQALQGDWSPDPGKIAPFTLAVGNAALEIRKIPAALTDMNAQISSAETPLNNIATTFRNLDKAVNGVAGALESTGQKSTDASKKITDAMIFSAVAAELRSFSAWLLGLGEAFNIVGEVARGVGTSMSLTFQAMGKALQGDFVGASKLITESTAALNTAGEVWETRGARIADVINNAMVPAMQNIPKTTAEMAAAVQRDMESVSGWVVTGMEIAAAAGETGGAELVENVGGAVEELATVAEPAMATFEGSVVDGIAGAVTAAETGAAAIPPAVAAPLAELPTTTSAAFDGMVAAVDAGGAAATVAGQTHATNLVTFAGVTLATMPAVAEAALGPVADVAAATGEATATGFITPVQRIPSEAAAQMSQVSGVVAAESGPAGAAGASVGGSIASGLIGALEGARAQVAAAASAIASIAVSALAAAAGVHSPSKKTYEIGTDLVEGLKQGLGTGTDLFNEIIAQFGDFVSAAREYRGVAETILSIEEQTKDFREGAQRDAIRREWEMVDVVSEHLSLKRDLITAERDLLPARQAAAAADREISSITRGSLEDRQRLITIDAERGRLKLEELKLERAAAGEQRTIKEQQLALEERLKAVKGDKAAEAQIKLEIDALKLRSDALKGDLELFRDKDKALQIEAEQIRLTNSLASTAAKLRREELIDAVKNGEDALIPHKQMIDLLEAEIAVWKSGEAVVANVTKNFVNSQALRIAALKDESLATAERIDAGTQLVAKLEQEGLISTTTAGKLRDLATAALTGKGTAGEFYNAINLLITALGGEATAAGVAQEKVGRLAGTISTDATPATTGLSQATDIAREAWEKSEPVIDAVTGAIATELDPAMKAQIETTMKSIEANNAEMMKLKELQDQVGWTTDEIIELNETPPDIDTSSVDDATKSMDKARKAAEKLKEALDDLDKNTSDNAKDAFEKAKGKGINTAPNVNPDFAYAQGGMVPGPVGAPMMAMVHGGERVLTPEQQKDISQGGGVQSTSVTNVTFNGWTDEHAIRRWESWQQKQRLLFGGVR